VFVAVTKANHDAASHMKPDVCGKSWFRASTTHLAAQTTAGPRVAIAYACADHEFDHAAGAFGKPFARARHGRDQRQPLQSFIAIATSIHEAVPFSRAATAAKSCSTSSNTDRLRITYAGCHVGITNAL
jgi:hypothetical protein